jgi:multidrug efflux system membrane fusion protein
MLSINQNKYRRILLNPPVFLATALCIAAVVLMVRYTSTSAYAATKENRGMAKEIPVTAATAEQQAMPVWIDALGTVTPRNYANVMPRVSGLLKSVDYKEGQPVKAGQLLATIDPEPYRILLQQAQAQLLRDQAQLTGAQADLERFETLLKQDSIAAQQVTDQRTTVAQLKGTVASDKATVENAQLQLNWTRITAPTSGIAGLRQVDVGNMVGSNGAVGGGNNALSGSASASTPIATIAQVQPITVMFPVTQSQLPALLKRERSKAKLPVQAWNQKRSELLATGNVIAIDNQISVATGSVMVKAEFANKHMRLFPNQFVNVRLLVDTLDNSIVIPSSAIAIGAPGSYVYVINKDNTVALRPVTPGVSEGDNTAITKGLAAGERVVSDGLDRLKDGSKVQIVVPRSSEPAPDASAKHKKDGAPNSVRQKK